MVHLTQITQALFTITLLGHQVLSHGAHDLSAEIASRHAFFQHSKRDLSHCSESLRKRGLQDKQLVRREAAIEKARATGGLPEKRRRSLESDTSTSHLSSLDVTLNTPGLVDIIYSNSSCVLNPEGEQGPFYVSGEYIRTDIVEDQPGVPLTIDAQFIDIATCEPIPDLMFDVWHCNATGVYGGVISQGNGNSDDDNNLDNTFLRGLQPTDDDGIATFHTIFPSHYSGRATHMHVLADLNGQVVPANNTYVGGTITYIGQLFFDQDLITKINAVAPYDTNTIAIVENADDRVVQSELANDSDPFFDYVLLGGDGVEDGVFAWIGIGVNRSATYTDEGVAAELTANGGVGLSSGMGAGAGGGPGAGRSDAFWLGRSYAF